jgi:uncharacterized membrane protein
MTAIKNFLKTNLFAGFIILIPIGATFTLLRWVITKSDNIFQVIPENLRPETHLGFDIPGLGLLVAFLLIMFVGLLGRIYFVSYIISLGEKVIQRIPLISGVYSAIKQLLDTIFASGGGERKPQKVVMIEYPRKGVYSIAFVTSETKGESQEKIQEDTMNVFIPTTPNPTSGFFLMIPASEITYLDMTVEEAFKLIMSGGIVSPKRKQK